MFSIFFSPFFQLKAMLNYISDLIFNKKWFLPSLGLFFEQKYLTASIGTEMSLITSDCFNVLKNNQYIIDQCNQTSMDRLETLFFNDKKV